MDTCHDFCFQPGAVRFSFLLLYASIQACSALRDKSRRAMRGVIVKYGPMGNPIWGQISRQDSGLQAPAGVLR